MHIKLVQESILAEREVLLNHELYSHIKHVDDLTVFLENHIYAVWDFMSLLKALQRSLTCVTVPWFASASPDVRYLINEIVLAEESDLYIDGRRLSHFEMYLDAMETAGANTSGITAFIATLQAGKPVLEAIQESNLAPLVKDFLTFTFQLIEKGNLHEIAAAFTFGREDLIPGMFHAILKQLKINFPATDLSKLSYYFDRHIELDGEEHGPLALRMVQELCGDDAQKWDEVIQVSKQALQVRCGLWDAVLGQLKVNNGAH